MRLDDMWKVPFRRVWCFSFRDWVKATIWCHFVIRVFPHTINLEGCSFLDVYKKDAQFFHDQYADAIQRAIDAREAKRFLTQSV